MEHEVLMIRLFKWLLLFQIGDGMFAQGRSIDVVDHERAENIERTWLRVRSLVSFQGSFEKTGYYSGLGDPPA